MDLEALPGCDLAVTSGGLRFERRRRFGARPNDLAADTHELLVPGVQHVLAALACRDPLEQAVALLEHPAQPGQRSGVPRLDLDQHLVEEAPPQLRTGLDQAEVVRPEEGHSEVAGQVDRAPPGAVHLDRASRAFSLDVEGDRELASRLAAGDFGLDPRARSDRAHELVLAARPRGRRESQHRHGLEQVRLALSVGADEHVDAGPGRQVQLRVVPVVAET